MSYDRETRGVLGIVGGGIIFLGLFFFGITVVFGSWYTVNERERAVFLRNGKLLSVERPGLGFKWPMIDSAIKVSLETQIATYEKLHTYSRDQQPAVIGISVNYRATEGLVDELYTQYGSLDGFRDRIITPKVMEEVKTVFGQFNAVTAIQERQRLNLDIRTAIIAAAKGPVVIENVQIHNIDFSSAYEQSIEQRMLAEVEVQRIRQNAEREKVNAEILVIQANATAAQVRALAEAEADRIKFTGNAEAEVIASRGKALGENPRLVELVQAEKWNGILPTTVLPTTAIPMINTLARQ
jgi:regulator of protease activity HflC (stomatin/prohibitin superfamily)